MAIQGTRGNMLDMIRMASTVPYMCRDILSLNSFSSQRSMPGHRRHVPPEEPGQIGFFLDSCSSKGAWAWARGKKASQQGPLRTTVEAR